MLNPHREQLPIGHGPLQTAARRAAPFRLRRQGHRDDREPPGRSTSAPGRSLSSRTCRLRSRSYLFAYLAYRVVGAVDDQLAAPGVSHTSSPDDRFVRAVSIRSTFAVKAMLRPTAAFNRPPQPQMACSSRSRGTKCGPPELHGNQQSVLSSPDSRCQAKAGVVRATCGIDTACLSRRWIVTSPNLPLRCGWMEPSPRSRVARP